MKSIFLYIITFLSSYVIFSQNFYLFDVKDTSALPLNIKNPNAKYATLTYKDKTINDAFNKFKAKSFKKAFPTATSESLKNVYLSEFSQSGIDVHIKSDAKLRTLYKSVENANDESLLTASTHYPNDFKYKPYWQIWGTDTNRALQAARLPEAWDISKGDPNIIIGISDGNFDINHEDLLGKFVYLKQPTASNIFEDHGTSVASAAAANTNNNLGIAGTGYNCKIAATTSWGNGAIVYNELLLMSQAGARVINTSWIGCVYNQTYQNVINEIRKNGTLFVAAAGNSGGANCGRNFTTYTDNYCYPASYDNVLSVTSIGDAFKPGSIYAVNNGVAESYQWKDYHDSKIGDPTSSHVHNNKVDICSPGGYGNIYATAPTNCWLKPPSTEDVYCMKYGTSLSTPFTAGIAALLFSLNPCLSPDEVEDLIKSTAANIYTIEDNKKYLGKLGAGRIDAYEALNKANLLLNISKGSNLYIQNRIITRNYPDNTKPGKYVSTKKIYFGKSVNPDPNSVQSNVEFGLNYCAIATAGEAIYLKPGTIIKKGAFFKGKIFTPCKNYGNQFGLANNVGSRIDMEASNTIIENLIYPNPTNYSFKIDNASDITIYNEYGVITKQVTGLTEVNVSDLSPGIYFVKINNDTMKKLIKTE